MRTLFVTGTDTGVGKTTVAAALAAAWTREGRRVAVMKPVETGCARDGARLVSGDGAVLREAARRWDVELELVAPLRYATPAAPETAALLDGVAAPDVEAIVAAHRRLAAGADVSLVEGAGGALVPLDGTACMADLARALGATVLVVARTALGTINHTLLTLEALRRRELRVAGVILNRTHRAIGVEERLVPDAIARHGCVRVLGTMPHGPYGSDRMGMEERSEAAARHLDLQALWEAL